MGGFGANSRSSRSVATAVFLEFFLFLLLFLVFLLFTSFPLFCGCPPERGPLLTGAFFPATVQLAANRGMVRPYSFASPAFAGFAKKSSFLLDFGGKKALRLDAELIRIEIKSLSLKLQLQLAAIPSG